MTSGRNCFLNVYRYYVRFNNNPDENIHVAKKNGHGKIIYTTHILWLCAIAVATGKKPRGEKNALKKNTEH